jgi:hypothetical protein
MKLTIIKPKTDTSLTQATSVGNNLTYNESGYTFNMIGAYYGGSDRKSSLGPRFSSSIRTGNMEAIVSSVPQLKTYITKSKIISILQ